MEFERRASPTQELSLPVELRAICSPVVVAKVGGVSEHPSRQEICGLSAERGFKQGFRVGFRYSSGPVVSATSNMKSATENAEVIDKHLAKEVGLGRVVHIPAVRPGLQVHTSRFGVIPKKHQPGKWRLIVDLSHPDGADGIEPELCSLRYTSVKRILALGPRTEMLVPEHIPGVKNVVVDALSRNNLAQFREWVPRASRFPSPVHRDLIQAMVIERLDWTSMRWRELLRKTHRW